MKRLVRCLGFVAVTCVAFSAHAAEPTDDDREAARVQLERGDALATQGDLANALVAYRAAHALVGLPTTGVAVVRAQIAIGQLLQALELARKVETLRVADDKPVHAVARAEAGALVRELPARIPTLGIEIDAPPDVVPTIEIDGAILAAGKTWERVNPGIRKVRVSAPGFRASESDVEVHEGEAAKVSVKLTARADPGRSAPPTPHAGFVPSDPASTPSSATDGPNGTLVAGIVVGGVGVVSVAVGAVLGAMTGSELADARGDASLCPEERCTPDGREAVDAARAKGVGSTVAFVAGGAAVATGAVLVVVGLREDDPVRTGLRIAPGPGDVGLAARWDF